MSNFSSFFRK